jgi:serine/threonine protein kinase
VLLDAKWEPRVADFGSAKFTDIQATITATGGTPLYMAPEIQEPGLQITNRIDIFAFGMILWEMLRGQSLGDFFDGQFKNPFGWLRKVSNGLRPPLDGLDPSGAELCKRCWDSEPTMRPSFADIFGNLRADGWPLWPDTDAVVVEEYVTRLETYEEDSSLWGGENQ